MTLFGSSGIRGKVFHEITLDLIMDIGRAVGSLHESVLVGRDTRTSGQMFKSCIMSGLLSAGSRASYAGIVSTPTLAWAGRNFDCGLMITASHNPGEYNGVKFWNPDGLAFLEDQRSEIENLLQKRRFRTVEWNKIGSVESYEGAVEDHKERILSNVGSSDIKVVVDCGNGATYNITPVVLKEMGCDVIPLHHEPDGTFPNRDPEPVEENLSKLAELVTGSHADLGVAHDGDGDRMTAIDERGRFVGGDKLLSIFALKQVQRSLVAPVDASMVLDDLLPNAEIYRTRVGDVFVGEEVKRRGADFGGEPSGTWIFPKHFLCPDGVYAAAVLADMVSERELSSLADEIPVYPQQTEGIIFEPSRRGEIIRALGEVLESIECIELTRVDGWRMQFEEGWALVRLSGTEPKVRIKVEARDRDTVKEIYRTIHCIVKDVLK